MPRLPFLWDEFGITYGGNWSSERSRLRSHLRTLDALADERRDFGELFLVWTLNPQRSRWGSSGAKSALRQGTNVLGV